VDYDAKNGSELSVIEALSARWDTSGRPLGANSPSDRPSYVTRAGSRPGQVPVALNCQFCFQAS